jgi:iron complex outermembrane receptor protein
MTSNISKFPRSTLARSVLLACSASASVLAVQPVLAQDAELKRVEITGSSIKRIAAEGALPVTVLKAEEIKATGATSVVDLVKRLSSAQGAMGESGSVGGSSYGFSGVSIHNVGEERTLVLLNGRRLAQFGGQTLTGFAAAFDLNAIPISAIEQVELLTDGASALYGSDAIAGVVNFITKRNTTAGDISIGFSNPASGAQEKRLSATKGFGSLEEDGYNVMLSFGHDQRTQLFSVDRSFAKTGKVDFDYNGKKYRTQEFSSSPIPANATDDQGQLINPSLKANGVCPPKTFRVTTPYNDGSGLVDDYCGFNYVGELEIYPERARDSFMSSLTKKVGDHDLFTDILLSRTTQASRIAPVPGSIDIPAGTALHDKYLLPLGITGDSTAKYRLYDLGKRTSNDTSDFLSLALGSRGALFDWDYNANFSHSSSNVKGNISGYPGALAVGRLRSSGLLDPFVGPGQQTPAAKAAIAATAFNGYFDGGVSQLDSLNLNGSREIGKLPGGAVMLGAGVNLSRERFESKPSLYAQGKLADPVAGTLCDGTDANPCDQRFGDAAASPPYSASRSSKGIFGELIMPLTKSLELGAAVRLDNYSDFGSASTAKTNFRWQPASNFLLRGSLGTGFRAPTVPQVNASLMSYGVSSENYTCKPELQAVATAQGAVCQSGDSQYDVLAGGNRNLKPEKSEQATLGFRLEPNNAFSLGADLWAVNIKNRVGQLTEDLVFANPGKYASSWASQRDVGTGVNYLAFLQDNKNLGNSQSLGIDLDFSARAKTDFGLLTSQLTLTHMIKEKRQLEINGPYYSAIGNFAELGTVTFRNKGRLSTSLKSGEWVNTLGINFQSGYKDKETDVEVLDSAGNSTGIESIRIKVKSYYTLDWQTGWNPVGKKWSLTAGLLNLMDTKPPFAVSASGLNRGQQYGYDDRYYDPRGRTLYVNASLKF